MSSKKYTMSSRPQSTSSAGSRLSGQLPPPSVSMQPAGHNKSSSLQDVDLNVSQGSDNSVVTLGGVEYPVGSRIGKSKMFVIGNPSGYQKQNVSSSVRSSVQSVAGSHAPIYRGEGKSYSFEQWNWTVIRFVCFIIVCMIMVAILAGTIAIAIQHKKSCTTNFLWWRGSTLYDVPVPYFYDTDASNVGDIDGVEKKDDYFAYMGIEAVVLKNFLPATSTNTDWDMVTSFTDVDPRLGSIEDFSKMVDTLHERNVKVLLHMCPWYTSKEHSWYLESQGSTPLSDNKYSNFYIWNVEAQSEGNWQHDSVRSAYYLYLDDPEKPLLNWDIESLHDTFNGELEYWLKRNVDGFVLCGLTKFQTSQSAINQFNHVNVLKFLEKFYNTLEKYSQGENSQRIMVIDREYMDRVEEDYVTIKEDMLAKVHLLRSPLFMGAENKTIGLERLVNTHAEWQNGVDRPWINWELTQLKDMYQQNVGALELFNLMLPGTISYTAGHEVGLYFLENLDARYQPPMVWQADDVVPYNPGSILEDYHIQTLRNVSTERNKAYSLRLINIPKQEEDGLNYEFLEVDPLNNFLLFKRFFPTDSSYYYAANFGDRVITKKLVANVAPWATVLADTHNLFNGKLELREVSFEPGQAIVFYPTT